MQNKAKSTLIVNLMGGPGTGKSTHAGGTFYRMKRSGINCEYIQEYAKDKTWSEDVQQPFFANHMSLENNFIELQDYLEK